LILDCKNGKYDSTIALLETFQILYEKLPTTVDEDYLKLTCNLIFSGHDTWRYQRLEQRWTIALKCMQIFTNVVECTRETSAKLVEAFCADRYLYQVRTL
jgi:hypothetical protein